MKGTIEEKLKPGCACVVVNSNTIGKKITKFTQTLAFGGLDGGTAGIEMVGWDGNDACSVVLTNVNKCHVVRGLKRTRLTPMESAKTVQKGWFMVSITKVICTIRAK